ncbi:MAG: aminoacyl-tRNA hydrolase [Dehalococcoidia bacterium]|jgi:PTH1 family peptidyl-tRNA hydrolase|nr:aminoacyl-tRNA hydrolase [Dehalococcoidia bacterium]
MKLIVGLGNPEECYNSSRHNVGFACIDAISHDAGIKVSERRRLVVIGQGQLGKEEVVLVKPRTFMNLSGEALSYLLRRFQTPLHDLLVIYDDMDLPVGKIRVRPSGSAGGHRGIESVIGALRSQDFPRIRVGIGHPPQSMSEVEFVLGAFNSQETPLIEEAVVAVRNAVADILIHGLDWAMNQYNPTIS